MKSFLCLSLIVGFFLRLSFVGDMEYKPDEHYMYLKSISVGTSEGWPLLGMPSGVFLKNPGLSVWVLVVIGKISYFITGQQTPKELCLGIRFLNCLALVLLLVLVLGGSKKTQNSLASKWAFAFACVNPISLIVERKIWAQSVLPIFCIFLVWSWFKRQKKFGAFCLGFIGILLGQIHMSGFFYFTAISMGAFFYCFKANNTGFNFKFYAIGVAVGFVPMLPWFRYFLFERPNKPMVFGLEEAIQFKYWVFWIFDSIGVHLGNSLGVRYGNSILDQNHEFIKFPVFFGNPTYLVGISYLALVLLGMFILVRFGIQDFKSMLQAKKNEDQILGTVLVGYGVVLTLATLAIRRYYLVIVYPLKGLWLARMSLKHTKGRELLAMIWILQLILSLSFMQFIHLNGGSERGDYGISYDLLNRAK